MTCLEANCDCEEVPFPTTDGVPVGDLCLVEVRVATAISPQMSRSEVSSAYQNDQQYKDRFDGARKVYIILLDASGPEGLPQFHPRSSVQTTSSTSSLRMDIEVWVFFFRSGNLFYLPINALKRSVLTGHSSKASVFECSTACATNDSR